MHVGWHGQERYQKQVEGGGVTFVGTGRNVQSAIEERQMMASMGCVLYHCCEAGWASWQRALHPLKAPHGSTKHCNLHMHRAEQVMPCTNTTIHSNNTLTQCSEANDRQAFVLYCREALLDATGHDAESHHQHLESTHCRVHSQYHFVNSADKG